MNTNVYIRIWWQIVMFSFFFFVLTAIAIHYDLTIQADRVIISFVQSFERPIFTSILITFTNIGSFLGTIIVLLILLYILFSLNWQKEAIILTTVTLATPIINIILKQLIQRPRPQFNRLIEIGGYSFPSGHTMYATSLYGITFILLWHKLKKRSHRLILLCFTILMISIIAISRIYVGVHYPSDIIGGIFASTFIISVTYYIYLLYNRRTTNENNHPL